VPDTVVVYTVHAEFPDEGSRERYLDWLRDGHVLAVVREGGALSGEVTIGDNGAIESRYLFGSPAAFEAYEQGAGVLLRADGAKRFPPESGVRIVRSLGRRAVRVPD
jgi:hypothetical protein